MVPRIGQPAPLVCIGQLKPLVARLYDSPGQHMGIEHCFPLHPDSQSQLPKALQKP